MDNNKLQILIKKTVTPRAKISALSMGLGAVEKADRESAPLFFAAVLELDVYKAALLSARRPEPFASDYRRAVLDRLAIPDGDFTAKEFDKLNKLGSMSAWSILQILICAKVVERVGKKGNAYIYRKLN